MKDQEHVTIFLDGTVWFNAGALRELLSGDTLHDLPASEALKVFQDVLDEIENQTVIYISDQMLLDSGLE